MPDEQPDPSTMTDAELQAELDRANMAKLKAMDPEELSNVVVTPEGPTTPQEPSNTDLPPPNPYVPPVEPPTSPPAEPEGTCGPGGEDDPEGEDEE